MTDHQKVREVGAIKAWIVRDDYEGRACIRFARHGIVARREGANELDSEFELVSCHRAREFDVYAANGDVPAQVLLEAGWHFGCAGCGQERVEIDGEDDKGTFEPVVYGNYVYCRQACKDAHDAYIAHRAAERKRGAEEALRKFPGVTIIHVEPEAYRSGVRHQGATPVPRVTFTFPGGQYPASWFVGDAVVSAALVDADAWQAWRKSTQGGANG